MAQTVDLWGATYSNVPALLVPSGNGTARFTDTSPTTATAADVAQGKYFIDSSGNLVEGTGSGGSSFLDSNTGVFTLSASARTMQIPHGLGKVPAMACFYPEANAVNTTDWGITVGGTFYKVKADGSNLFPFTTTSGWSADRSIPNRVGLYCTSGVDILENVRMIYLYDDDDWGIIDVDDTYIYIKAGYASNPWLWNGIQYRWWVIASNS